MTTTIDRQTAGQATDPDGHPRRRIIAIALLAVGACLLVVPFALSPFSRTADATPYRALPWLFVVPGVLLAAVAIRTSLSRRR